MFGLSLDDKVRRALDQMGDLHIDNLDAHVQGHVVTLVGVAPDDSARSRALEVFGTRVDTETTVNRITVREAGFDPEETLANTRGPRRRIEPLGPRAAKASATMRLHAVTTGETLETIARKYYGKPTASQRIVDANKELVAQGVKPGMTLVIH